MQPKTFRWYGVMTLFVIVAVSYIDRINIAMLITDQGFLDHMSITREDRLSQGLLATAFMVGYGVSSLVLTPFCAALLGVRRSLLIGLVFWGGMTYASPMLDSYGMLLASRVLLGISEGPLFSLASSYIKAHFESHENGKPNSFVNMGTGMGLAVGYPFVGYLIAAHDWANSFHILGVLNIALGVPLIVAFIRMPHVDSGMPKPRSFTEAVGQVGAIVRGSLHTRHLLLVTVLTAAFLSYLWGSSNWLPAYLREARGFSLKDMGWLASLPQYAALVAVFIGGVLIDKVPRARVPLIFVAGSAGVGLAVWLGVSVADSHVAAYCLIAANFFWGLMSPAIPSTVQHFSQPAHVASAFGVVNGVGSLVAGFMPAFMGWVIAWIGAGQIDGRAGFSVGFGMLIGTQVAVGGCGLLLYLRERGVDQTRPAEVSL